MKVRGPERRAGDSMSVVRGLFFALALAGALPIGAASAQAGGGVQVMHGWARATPPGVAIGAAYLIIENRGSTPDRVVALSSSVAKRTELHETMMDGDVMKMHKLDGLEVSAGASVRLEPGAKHLMLAGLERPLKEGETFSATLTFEHAGKVEVQIEVKGMGQAEHSPSHGTIAE